MILFENIYIWFVSRFMMGVAGTILFVVSETWINEVAEDHYRGRVMGLYTFVFSATLGISPLFIVVLGAQGNLPFIVALVIITAGLLPLRWTRGTTPDFSGGKASHVLMFCLLAPTLVGATALMAFEESLVVTLMPVYALRNGLTEASAALILTVAAIGSMAAQPLVGRLADSMNRNLLLFLCALLISSRSNLAAVHHSNEDYAVDSDVYMGWCNRSDLHCCAYDYGLPVSWCSAGGWKCRIRIDVGCIRYNCAGVRWPGHDRVGAERIRLYLG